MSNKTDKLVQRIQEIHNINARIERDAAYQTISQELEKIADSLKSEKLTIQIYSRFPILAQALHKFFSSSHLTKFYQFILADLPSSQVSNPTLPAALILQLVGTQQQTHYPLLKGKITIGRHPECQIQIPNNKDRVSGYHAEIQPVAGNSSPSWEICDNSTNGTYINQQKLTKGAWQKLQPGDKITLGYSVLNEKNAELIFESQADIQQENELDKQLAGCDVLCLVVNPSQPITLQEKQFLETSKSIKKLFIVADISGTGQIPHHNSLSELKTKIPMVIVPLFLRNFFPNTQATAIQPDSQAEFERFSQSLEPGKEYEDVLINRIQAQLIPQINYIEKRISLQEEGIKRKIQQEENKLYSGGDLKEQFRNALQKVKNDKDKFFSKVKSELNQSKAALLDEFSKRSILTQIKTFTDNLQPVLFKRGGFNYIQLCVSNSSDVNSTMTQLYRNSLTEWSNGQWQHICNTYDEGGLNGLFHRSYTLLNAIYPVKSLNLLQQPIQGIDIAKYFQASVVEANCEVRYQEVTLIGYLFKNTRSQVTSIVSLIVWGLGAFITLFFQNYSNQKAVIVAGLTLIIMIFTIPFLIYNYSQEKHSNLDKEGEKLKKDVSAHFQAVAKSFVDKLLQALNMKLEAEDQRMKGILETVYEEFVASMVELDKNQVIVKANLEKLKLQQKALEKEKAELQKFKH